MGKYSPEDIKRTVLKRWQTNKNYFIKSIQIKSVFNWQDALIDIHHPVCTIAGRNGVGKSTLINLVKHISNILLGNKELGILSELGSYEVTIKNLEGKKIIVKDRKVFAKEFSMPKILDLTFNTSLYAFYKTSSGEKMMSYLQTLPQYGSMTLPGELVQVVAEILGKDIVSVKRVFDEDEERDFFIINLGDGTEYNSYTMGAGEFYVCQFIWSLSNAPDKSIILIEEPENFLHCEAQKKLLELIYEFSLKKEIQFLITTHSPTLLDNTDIYSRILIKQDLKNIVSISDCETWLANSVLGTKIQNKIEILVEDNMSSLLLKEIIANKNRYLFEKLLITQIGGEGNIRKVLSSHTILKSSKLVGILDGDQTINANEPERLFKLPGKESPEKVLLNFISSNPLILCSLISKKKNEVLSAIKLANTLREPHSGFSILAKSLGEDEIYLFIALAKRWIKENSSSKEFLDFYTKFDELIK